MRGEAELEALRRAVSKYRAYGGDRWATMVIDWHGLISTTRDRGRPPQVSSDRTRHFPLLPIFLWRHYFSKRL